MEDDIGHLDKLGIEGLCNEAKTYSAKSNYTCVSYQLYVERKREIWKEENQANRGPLEEGRSTSSRLHPMVRKKKNLRKDDGGAQGKVSSERG